MNDLIQTNEDEEISSDMIEVEKSRAIGEIQAALVIARKFPRDENEVYKRMLKSCERVNLASKAIYKYTKGQEIEGPTIRLAEMMAQCYRNLDFGIKELSRKEGSSIVQSYCWDLETNTKRTLQFEVKHLIDLKHGEKKILTSDRDIYEHIANYGARRLRSCILAIIPKDFVDDAVLKCRQTLHKNAEGDKDEPLQDKVRRIMSAFSKLGVNISMVEEYLGHSIDIITIDEFIDLVNIFNALKDKLASRSDFFNVVEKKSQTAEVIERLKGIKNGQEGGAIQD